MRIECQNSCTFPIFQRSANNEWVSPFMYKLWISLIRCISDFYLPRPVQYEFKVLLHKKTQYLFKEKTKPEKYLQKMKEFEWILLFFIRTIYVFCYRRLLYVNDVFTTIYNLLDNTRRGKVYFFRIFIFKFLAHGSLTTIFPETQIFFCTQLTTDRLCHRTRANRKYDFDDEDDFSIIFFLLSNI